jgi:hypothetical protein
VRDAFIDGSRHSISTLEGFQDAPARPSGFSNKKMKMKIYEKKLSE